MAQNVTIAGASYLGVPSIEMPKTGGGTAVFVDTSDANAAAGDITKGKTAYVGGTKITGTLEASPSGGAKETWVIKSDAAGVFATTQIAFTSNGQKFTSIGAEYSAGSYIILRYDNNEIAGYDPGFGGAYEFDNEAYRKLTFDTPPTGALLTWLQANAVKQPDDTAVQDSKAVTITSNGTVSVTPDAPYDALSSVDVTVNVASVSTVTINCKGNDTFAFWLSPDGVLHNTSLNAGANTIIVTPYSPIGVYNSYSYALENLNNIVYSGRTMVIELPYGGTTVHWRIYYATAITASATQPTD